MCCSSSLEWTEPALRGATCLLHCLVKLDRVIDTFGYAIRRNSDERRPPRVAGLTSSDSGLAQTPAYHLEDLAVCPPAAEKGARCNGARSRLFLIPPPPRQLPRIPQIGASTYCSIVLSLCHSRCCWKQPCWGMLSNSAP